MHQHATSTGANISILLGIAEQVPQTVILHQRRVFHEMAYRQIVFYFIFYVAYTHMNIASEAVFISGPTQLAPIKVGRVAFKVVHSEDNRRMQCRAYNYGKVPLSIEDIDNESSE